MGLRAIDRMEERTNTVWKAPAALLFTLAVGAMVFLLLSAAGVSAPRFMRVLVGRIAQSMALPATHEPVDQAWLVEMTGVDSAEYLQTAFCTPLICGKGDWQAWIDLEAGDPWSVDQLRMVHSALIVTVTALEEAGLPGRTLLDGYRFSYQAGHYVAGSTRWNAFVDHDTQTIILADSAFQDANGFILLHELGHVVDRHSDHLLGATFHVLAGSSWESGQTADVVAVNDIGHSDLGEATADAFAVWVSATQYDAPPSGSRLMRSEADYDLLIAAMRLTMAYVAVHYDAR